METFFYYIKENSFIMWNSPRLSSVFIFIIAQAIVSIFFYMDDDYISGKESLMVLGIGVMITIIIQWSRGMFKTPKNLNE
jgi:hypothetical protein